MKLHMTTGYGQFIGSTGLEEILRYLADRYQERIGNIPMPGRFMAVESTSIRPSWLPNTIEFVPMDVPLDKLYATRHTNGVPQRLANLPKDCWKRTTSGCGADPGTAALGTYYIWSNILSAREVIIEHSTETDYLLAEYHRLSKYHQVEMGNELVSIYALSAAGSTGHGVLLPCIDDDLVKTDAYIVVLLAGAMCGSSADNFVTQKRNAAMLLKSLAKRVIQNSDRIAVVYADSKSAHRSVVVNGLGELAWDLLFHTEGVRLRREWRNWVSQNTREGRPIIFLNEFRRTIPEKMQQYTAAIEILMQGMEI